MKLRDSVNFIALLALGFLAIVGAASIVLPGPDAPVSPIGPMLPRGMTNLSGLTITGQADQDQLVVVGHSTQTNDLLSLRNSDGTEKLIVNKDGAATFQSNVATTGNMVVTGRTNIGTFARVTNQTAVAVTAGSIITPTGTYQPLTSAAAVTCSTTKCIGDGISTGDLLVLRNANASDAITIDGTGGNVECKTDKVLGAGDTLTLIWNGTDWNCIALHDNS